MGFATERDKVHVIQQGLNSAFWNDYLLPMLQDKAKSNLQALAIKASEDDDIKRGRFQAYQDIINCPGRDVQAFNEAQQVAEDDQKSRQTEEYRAQQGFRSPFREAPEVGDLKKEDAVDNPAA